MFCKYCGTQINPSQFCKYCGRRLAPDTQEPPSFAAPERAVVMTNEPAALEMTTCPFCREEIRPGAIKCKHCGSDLSKPPITPQVSATIREALRTYKYVVSMECSECGYTGPMGLVKTIKPLYQRGWVQYVFFTGFFRNSLALLRSAFEISLFRGKAVQYVVFCPACRKTLKTQNPPVEKSMFLIGR